MLPVRPVDEEFSLRLLKAEFGTQTAIEKASAMKLLATSTYMDEEEASSAISKLAEKHKLFFGPEDTLILK